jgi:hypothetical protein
MIITHPQVKLWLDSGHHTTPEVVEAKWLELSEPSRREKLDGAA